MSVNTCVTYTYHIGYVSIVAIGRQTLIDRCGSNIRPSLYR